MSKKFFIVKDQTEPLTGGILTYKVLNYYPMMAPVPIPVNTSSSLSIPLESDTLLPTFSPIFPGLEPEVNLTGKPFEKRFVPNYFPMVQYGAPIMKYSMAQRQVPGIINISFGQNNLSINVPYGYFRDVVNDIYYRAFDNVNDSEPKIAFNITGLGINTNIKTTYSKMMSIIRYINNKYSNINYIYNGQPYGYGAYDTLYNQL